ncbi:2-amino-4-hydroxy-6-hydroxymethyldihydropteridine diphosphokinase [Zhongshania guokunii]|uniref:2-amino-4-hydroxy-6-hydroxymethyldihydropteridine diphosphokinase n=1 Tax=Zhongshania guokunii TaxID=641783 RepID=A0ABV3U371_9GAMM
MAEVFLGLGSNIQRYRHMTSALDALSEHFAPLRLSRVYESESVGFRGSVFLNMVVAFNTEMALAPLIDLLREIEVRLGRVPGAPKFSPRTLDIDILSYDNLCGNFAGIELPRDEVTYNAFVLRPLSELAPDHCHPVSGKTYRELWAGYVSEQKLWPVEFCWSS